MTVLKYTQYTVSTDVAVYNMSVCTHIDTRPPPTRGTPHYSRVVSEQVSQRVPHRVIRAPTPTPTTTDLAAEGRSEDCGCWCREGQRLAAEGEK